jgi:large subunit ribosomal protein L18
MPEGPRYKVPFRRRREGKTNYRYRLKLLKSRRPRAVVRITNRRVIVAIETFNPNGDVVKAVADSFELKKVGFPETSLTSTSAAYLTGYLAGLRSLAAGEDKAVLDGGLTHPTPGGRVMGALKGLLEAGIDIPHSEEGFPSRDRLEGKHLKSPLTENLGGMVEKLQSCIEKGVKSQ